LFFFHFSAKLLTVGSFFLKSRNLNFSGVQQETTVAPETNTTIATTPPPTTMEPCFIDKNINVDCYFLPEVVEKFLLFKRCINIKSPRNFEIGKLLSINVDDRKCGVTNATDVDQSDICYSALDDPGISTTLTCRN
jgi:hypothetical protein